MNPQEPLPYPINPCNYCRHTYEAWQLIMDDLHLRDRQIVALVDQIRKLTERIRESKKNETPL